VFQKQVDQIGAAQPYGIVKRGSAQVVARIHVSPGRNCGACSRQIARPDGLAQFRTGLQKEAS
jgi:hypothetical protein